jgi:hypothetical protein
LYYRAIEAAATATDRHKDERGTGLEQDDPDPASIEQWQAATINLGR